MIIIKSLFQMNNIYGAAIFKIRSFFVKILSLLYIEVVIDSIVKIGKILIYLRPAEGRGLSSEGFIRLCSPIRNLFL